jgi:hypothetical protein
MNSEPLASKTSSSQPAAFGGRFLWATSSVHALGKIDLGMQRVYRLKGREKT